MTNLCSGQYQSLSVASDYVNLSIANTFTGGLTHLTGKEQKAVKTTAFDLQMDPVNPEGGAVPQTGQGEEQELLADAVIVTDNVIQSAEAMKDYLEYVQTNPDYEAEVVHTSYEKDDGMSIRYKIR